MWRESNDGNSSGDNTSGDESETRATASLAALPGAPRDPVTGRFHNNTRVVRHGSFFTWQWQRWKDRRAGRLPPRRIPVFPVATPSQEIWHPTGLPTVTWIGHATVLLQIGGKTVITDPVFTGRASPLRFAGPRRIVPAVPPLDKLPPIDIVLLSHNHYDHLDLPALQALSRQPGGAPLFFVPLGLKDWLAQRGIHGAIELDWWQSASAPAAGARIHLVPAQHWSRRSWGDLNMTLWGGWVAEWPHFRFLFTGDTGYSADFKTIGARFGGFDLAAIPIGAYEPRWFMQGNHVNPAEAVRIFQDVRARQAVAIHWGTFPLTDEPLDEPPQALAKALADARIPAERFWALMHGETRRVAQG